MNLYDKIINKARLKRRRIGIGLAEVDEEIISGLEKCKPIADIIVVGSKIDGFECHTSEYPNKELVTMLKKKEIDGMVWGNLGLGIKNRYEELKKQFNISKIYRCSLIRDAIGREFFFGPTGLNEGYKRDDKIIYIEKVINLIKKFDLEPKIGLLSPITHGEIGRAHV